MDYDRWWPLHLSAARGEQLSEVEGQIYLEGLQQLQRTERSQMDRNALEAAKRALGDLERQQAFLRTRREQLDAEILATEAALDQCFRQVLDAKE